MSTREILNCDCMELMQRYPNRHFDLAIVDPPYRDDNQPTQDMRARGSMATLTGRPSKQYWQELRRVSREQIIWGANNFELPQFMGFIVWEKGIPLDFTMSMAEIASLSAGLATISKIVRIPVQGQPDRIHPTQKPVSLYGWILRRYAEPGQKILDTHLGSGSSAIACHYFGAHFTGCEIDAGYYESALRRIERETAQDAFNFDTAAA